MVIKIGLLGYNFNEYARSRIIHEAKKMNIEITKLPIDKLCLGIGKNIDILYKGKSLNDFDVIIPRFSTTHYRFGLMAMRQIEEMGIPTVNTHNTIKFCQNKYLTSLKLKHKKIPQPNSYVTLSSMGMLKIVGNIKNPLIFKLLHGGKGTGVALINSIIEAEDWFTTITKMGKMLYVQEYIPHTKNEDYRLFVVGDKVVGAMKRTAKSGWKTNFSLGGKVESVKPSKELQHLALRSAKAVKADICGVDIMKGVSGLQVIEVNQHPGFEGLEKATGKNIAREIVKFAVKKVKK